MNINTDVADSIIKVIEYLLGKFGIVVDWTSTSILPYIQTLSNKIVAYKQSIAYMWLVLGIVLILFSVTLLVKNNRKRIFDYESMMPIVLIFFTILGIIVCIYNIKIIIVCNTFPEKIVLDYISDLLNNKPSN